MENDNVGKYEMAQAWKQVEENIVQSVNLNPEMNEVDSSDEAIQRRDSMEKMVDTPSTILKTIKLDGPLADKLDYDIRSTGNVEWTDGYSGNGPYLPQEVEEYILKVAGNETEEPFTVRFIKYGSVNPLEMRGPTLYLEYEQEHPNTSNEFRR